MVRTPKYLTGGQLQTIFKNVVTVNESSSKKLQGSLDLVQMQNTEL